MSDGISDGQVRYEGRVLHEAGGVKFLKPIEVDLMHGRRDTGVEELFLGIGYFKGTEEEAIAALPEELSKLYSRMLSQRRIAEKTLKNIEEVLPPEYYTLADMKSRIFDMRLDVQKIRRILERAEEGTQEAGCMAVSTKVWIELLKAELKRAEDYAASRAKTAE